MWLIMIKHEVMFSTLEHIRAIKELTKDKFNGTQARIVWSEV